MADIGYVRSQLGGITDADTKRVLTTIFEHILGNLRFGAPDHQVRATNFQDYFQQSTTASDTTSFTFTHGMGVTPKLAIPVLDLSQAGSRLVPLEVTRAADGTRLYLKTTAGSTSAPFMLLVE